MTEAELKITANRLLEEKIGINPLNYGCGMAVYAKINNRRAREIFQGYFRYQEENGCIPDAVISNTTVPPVFGFVLLEIGKNSETKEIAKAFYTEFYPKIKSFHRFLYENRDDNDHGLVHISHPNESGQVNSPTFDHVLEQSLSDFVIEEPLFNALLSWSNEAMIEIGRIINADVTDFVLWNELTVFSMNNLLWDEAQGIYNTRDLVSGKTIPGDTLSGLLPMITDIPTLEQAENILRNIEDEFFSGTDEKEMYLCPTYDITAKDIDFGKATRGGIQPELNWLLYNGLKRFKMDMTANRGLSDMILLIEEFGFQSHFDPRKINKEKVGETNNAATAAVYLAFLSQKNNI